MRAMGSKTPALPTDKDTDLKAIIDERGRTKPTTGVGEDARIASVLNAPPLLSPIWPSSRSLQSRSKSVTAHEVIAAALKAEWLGDKSMRERGMEDAYGQELSRVVEDPDLTNDWENVLRAAMHGRHLPILAALPTDMAWFKIEGGVTTAELGSLKTLSEDSWSRATDGATRMCASVRENYISIWRAHCHDKHADSKTTTPRLVQADGNPTHSNQVLSMMPAAENLSRILVAFGTSWREPLTLWDGNHRAICFYAADAAHSLRQKGLKWRASHAEHDGCDVISRRDDDRNTSKPLTLYVGLSKTANIKFMCHMSSLHEKQRLTLIDGGPLVSESHRVGMRSDATRNGGF
jgi:hypothetical protein